MTGTIVESVGPYEWKVQFENGVVVNLPSHKLSIVVGEQDSALPPQDDNNVIAEEEQVPPSAEGASDFPSTSQQEEEHTANILFVPNLLVGGGDNEGQALVRLKLFDNNGGQRWWTTS